MIDIGTGMATSLAGIALAFLGQRHKFIRVLLIPKIDPTLACARVVGAVVVDGGWSPKAEERSLAIFRQLEWVRSVEQICAQCNRFQHILYGVVKRKRGESQVPKS